MTAFPAESITIIVEGCEEADLSLEVETTPESEEPEYEPLPQCEENMNNEFTSEFDDVNTVKYSIVSLRMMFHICYLEQFMPFPKVASKKICIFIVDVH